MLLQIFDPTIFPVLFADGLTNGAIYALLSLALVLVFAVDALSGWTRQRWVRA